MAIRHTRALRRRPGERRAIKIAPEDWHSAFDIHVHAIFYLCRATVPHMRKLREASIVLISSTAGIRAVHTNIAYQVVKGAVPHFARRLPANWPTKISALTAWRRA